MYEDFLCHKKINFADHFTLRAKSKAAKKTPTKSSELKDPPKRYVSFELEFFDAFNVFPRGKAKESVMDEKVDNDDASDGDEEM